MNVTKRFVSDRELWDILPESLLQSAYSKGDDVQQVFPKAEIVALLVGEDPVVLETRSMVLRSVGYAVVSCLSTATAFGIFVDGDFDVVILCHSIPATERTALARAVHGYSPGTPVALVSAGYPAQDSSVDAVIENEPKQLLQELPKLLHINHPL
ncbi:MAG: hypothetical protein JOZ10_16020 [Acidobacteria bacterium]|nr:hypothetical protein [Acidobacteriota bacterium]